MELEGQKRCLLFQFLAVVWDRTFFNVSQDPGAWGTD